VADANAGDNVPALTVSACRVATAEAARVAVMVYVLVVTPSDAATSTVMVFDPTVKGMLPDKLPEATAVPFTVMVAPASAAVGRTNTEATVLASATV